MLHITTTILKPVSQVWKLYTSPGDMNNWNHASPDWSCKNSLIDLRDGGKFASTMFALDGSFEFTFGGTYTLVKIEEAIFAKLEDGRNMNVYFEKIDANTTKVSIDFDPETVNLEAEQQAGWQSILDNFKKYCEK
jgi:uncharacterized protein YndB with AHSA1/START domain